MSLKGKRILIVDDEPEMRNLLADEFSFYGADVGTAESGIEALQILTRGPFEVVRSDVRMANGDGLFLLKAIRTKIKSPPLVVMMTGFSEYSVSEMYDLGAEAIFSKPFELDEIVKRILTLLKSYEDRLLTEPATWQHEMTLNAASLHFGRGGFFVPIENPQLLRHKNIKVTFPDIGVICLGIPQWIRKAKDNYGPAGAGVEITMVLEGDKNGVIHRLKNCGTEAYIPRA